MVFYIFPPTGSLSLANVERYLVKRMSLALKISECQGNFLAIRDILEEVSVVTDCDCLIEGSRKDQISHFLLRLACADNPEMSDFLLKSESDLFMYRLSCMTEPEIYAAINPLKKLQRKLQAQLPEHKLHTHIWLSSEMERVSCILQSITAVYSWEDVIVGYVHGVKMHIAVPFQCVLDLVAQRLVPLKQGMACVPSSKLPELFKSLFISILSHGINLAKQQVHMIREDPRMRSLFRKIQLMFCQSHPAAGVGVAGVSSLRCENVDRVSECFPLCMSVLHRTLKTSHRLRHQARIQYTLFLKEVGLPLHEAIEFWRSEYSKPGSASRSGENACGHHWERDGRRYTYSIRHLYGLEGRRVNYRGHCCSSLQCYSPGPLDKGGCPFKNNSVPSLQKLLAEQGLKDRAQCKILNLVENGHFNEACTKYMSAKLISSVHRTYCVNKAVGTSGLELQNIESCHQEQSDLLEKRNKVISKTEDATTEWNKTGVKTNVAGTNLYTKGLNRNDATRTELNATGLKTDVKTELGTRGLKIKAARTELSATDSKTDVKTDSGTTELKAKAARTELNVEGIQSEVSSSQIGQSQGVTASQCCYQHDTCPSSQAPLVKEGERFNLQKPLQYYISYQKLRMALHDIYGKT